MPGRELSARLYAEVVRPIWQRHFSAIPYAAALIGCGSDVLGFDNEMSMDHGWGPRLTILLPDDASEGTLDDIRQILICELPTSFLGHSTCVAAELDVTRAENWVQVATLTHFLRATIGFDILGEPTIANWLVCPSQRLRSVSESTIHHDDVDMRRSIASLAWYPHDVALYILASTWTRIGQEEHLVGRAGFVGDEIGARLIAARLVRDLMRVCFFLERRYAPYAKWFGTAFSRLDCAPKVGPLLESVLAASSWSVRDLALGRAYAAVAEIQNSSGLCELQNGTPGSFHDRPFTVIEFRAKFAASLVAQIRDPDVLDLANRRLIGNVDLISDSTDVLEDAARRKALEGLFLVS